MTRDSKVMWIAVWVAFCQVALIGGEYYNLYEKLSWFDLVLHFVAGFILLLMVCSYENPTSNKELFFVTALVTSMLVSWEIFEYFMDTYFDLNMQKDGIKDTMEDMLVGKLGCLLAVPFVWRKI